MLDDRLGRMHRIAAIKSLAQRFAYMGLVGGAFALMLLGRADTLMIERLRVQVTDAIAVDVGDTPEAIAAAALERLRG